MLIQSNHSTFAPENADRAAAILTELRDRLLQEPGVESFRVARGADEPNVADAASELFASIFGPEKSSVRSVFGVASLPLGRPVELEAIFEVVRLRRAQRRSGEIS
jgi:enamine deaminase RidA (YjgF/YER057c/UK114 family)